MTAKRFEAANVAGVPDEVVLREVGGGLIRVPVVGISVIERLPDGGCVVRAEDGREAEVWNTPAQIAEMMMPAEDGAVLLLARITEALEKVPAVVERLAEMQETGQLREAAE